MATHQLDSEVVNSFADRRKAGMRGSVADPDTRISSGVAMFTANAGGTTTTIVGANAAPGTNDVNVVRRGERFRLFTSAGVLKEETVFQVTTIAVAGSTTVTFAPAAAVATASGDIARSSDAGTMTSNDSLDDRLLTIGGMYTQRVVDTMTQNDKQYALRVNDDPLSL
jgi:hypothetical protein